MKSRSYQSKQADYDNLCEKEQLMRGAVDGCTMGESPRVVWRRLTLVGCIDLYLHLNPLTFSQFLYSSEVLIMKILLCNIGLLFQIQTLLLSISRILVM